ncbi:hypothetical protein KC19_VG127200 [Ceratodon purpureus]|uniref:Uncharacterized protein n=1 Tax=Ceratodon purpureus TaxID=3225 RepID=A0A8T0HPF0_CERPU|nr:hypothetical protein KC19_VG127200 [Ceratodon purpureus]
MSSWRHCDGRFQCILRYVNSWLKCIKRVCRSKQPFLLFADNANEYGIRAKLKIMISGFN